MQSSQFQKADDADNSENRTHMLELYNNGLRQIEECILCLTDKSYIRIRGKILPTGIYPAEGTTDERPYMENNQYDRGFQFFDKTLGLPIMWNGTKWIKMDGSDA